MKTLLTYGTLIVTLLIVPIGMISAKSNVKISISENSGKDNLHLTVSIYGMFTFEPIVIVMNNDKSNELTLTIARPTFATLAVGERRSAMYIEPNYDLVVIIDADPAKPFCFHGEGAAANNYLARIDHIRAGIEATGSNAIYQLDEEWFSKRLDSLKNSLADFHREFMHKGLLNRKVMRLFAKRNEIILLGWKHVARQGTSRDDPTSLIDIPMDEDLLKSGLVEYPLLLLMKMQLQPYYHLRPANTGTPGQFPKFESDTPVLIKEQIIKANYPSFIEEYFLARNIDSWITLFGKVPTLDDELKNFRKRYPHSVYLPALEKKISGVLVNID